MVVAWGSWQRSSHYKAEGGPPGKHTADNQVSNDPKAPDAAVQAHKSVSNQPKAKVRKAQVVKATPFRKSRSGLRKKLREITKSKSQGRSKAKGTARAWGSSNKLYLFGRRI